MKSLKIGVPVSIRIAAVALFAAVLLLYSPAMAVDSYDFGNVEVGSEATVTLDIENFSPSTELTFNVSFASNGENGFTSQNPTVTIPKGGIAQVQIVFSPTTVGSCEDTLQFLFGNFNVEQMQIPLQGTGIEAAAAASESQSRAAFLQRWASPLAKLEVNGKPLGEQVQACFESADNHGEAVNCVAQLAAELRKERRISRHNAWEMKEYAAKSRYHFYKKHHKIEKKEAAYREIKEKREKHSRRWSNWD
jgi:hypothetical protein